ncbi:MAG: tyrosine-type recombinase/integrase [Phenylobacterium sp.]|uniref:DUF6538 domain-containing protein n=1 Tax=Phenylobacterium sp. TaxID=1871053 RepID=UPI0027361035|nr:tyrosine-type recombinase/integrase [Phenylobacterium sp.]MDP3745617.1 tyrosine-type recombinase/integrase [Phenylobacterium sp.]
MRIKVCNNVCFVKLPTYIRRRAAVFYFVRRVPELALHRPEFKGQPIWRISLKTTEREEARQRGAAQLAWFEAVVNGDAPEPTSTAGPGRDKLTVPDESAMHALAGDYFRREFERWKRRRLSAPVGSVSGDHVDDEYELRLMGNPREDIETSVDAALSRYIREHDLALPEGSEQRYHLRSLLLQVWDDLSPAVDDLVRRERFAPDPKTQLIRNAPDKITIAQSWSLRQLEARFMSTNPRIGESSKRKIKHIVAVWDGLGLGELGVTSISHRDISQFVGLSRRTPVNASKRFPAVTLLAAIELNSGRAEPYPTLSDKTIFDGYIPALRKLLEFAIDEGIIENDPVTRLPKRTDVSVTARHRIFQAHELTTLFQHPCFTGCAGNERPNSPGTLRRDDEYHWAPIIALFTGARASEVAQLTVQRCVIDAPVPHIEIAALENGRLKSGSAYRLIPIHSKLVAAGFIEFVKRQQKLGVDRLFPAWERSKNPAQMFSSARVIRNFNEVIAPACVDRIPAPTFHTLRANFKTQLVIGKVPVQYQNALMGHAQSGEDPSYMGTLELRTLSPEMERASFDGLDLSHLFKR